MSRLTAQRGSFAGILLMMGPRPDLFGSLPLIYPVRFRIVRRLFDKILGSNIICIKMDDRFFKIRKSCDPATAERVSEHGKISDDAIGNHNIKKLINLPFLKRLFPVRLKSSPFQQKQACCRLILEKRQPENDKTKAFQICPL